MTLPGSVVPLGDLVDGDVPLLGLVETAQRAAALAGLALGDPHIDDDPDVGTTVVAGSLVLHEPIGITVPGLPVQSLVLGDPAGPVAAELWLDLADEPIMRLTGVRATVLIDPAVLRDVAGDGPGVLRGDLDLCIGPDGVELACPAGLTLDPAHIADTGIELAAAGVRILVADAAAGDLPEYTPDGFAGLALDHASVRFPTDLLGLAGGGPVEFSLTDATIGATGLTGSAQVTLDAVPASLAGFEIRLREVQVDITDNLPHALRVRADLRLAPFDLPDLPRWIGIDVNLAGPAVVLTLSAGQPANSSPAPGVVRLEVPGVFRADVTALRLELADPARVWVTGTLQLLLPGVTWPAVAFDEFGVDSAGGLRVPPGGLRFATPLVLEAGPLTISMPTAAFGSAGPGRWRLELSADAVLSGPVTGHLTVDRLIVDWAGAPDGAVTAAFEGVAMSVAPVQLAAGRAAITVAGQLLTVELASVDLGALGWVPVASLIVGRELVAGVWEPRLAVSAAVNWADVVDRLDLPDLFGGLEMPSTGSVAGSLRWYHDAGRDRVDLRVQVELASLGGVLAGLPAAWRPEVRDPFLVVEASYDTGDPGASDAGAAIVGTVAVRAAVRLPLPSDGPDAAVRLRLGDPDGWVGVQIAGTLGAGVGLTVALTDLVELTANLPGMPQDPSLLTVTLTAITLDAALGDTSGARLGATGAFVVRPLDPPPSVPLATHVRTLAAGLGTITGVATVDLAMDGERVGVRIGCGVDAAGVSIDLFGMLGPLTAGLADPTDGADGVALDTTVGVRLVSLALTAGIPPDRIGDPDAREGVAVELVVRAHAGALAVDTAIRLSDTGLAVEVPELRIPLRLPTLPIAPEVFDGLATPADWDLRRAALAAGGNPGAAFVFGVLDDVRRRLPSAGADQRYAALSKVVVELMVAVGGALHVDTDAVLVLENVGLRVPFADPRGVEVGGTARLTGFGDTDPLKPLESVRLGLGLGPDLVFARFQAGDSTDRLPLPDFGGRFPGGEVALSELAIGYGFTRNSLAVVVRGELVLPPAVIDLVDTSEYGAGIRLPSVSRVGFRLDLIPVVLGPIDFVLPLVELQIDLRSPGAPAIADPATCAPHWDGLQVHVPGVLRADVKQFACSPVFLVSLLPNLRFDGDLELGTPDAGLRVVIDDLFWLIAVNGSLPIPFFASWWDPWYENLCVRLQVAGFGIGFHLQHPFPSFDPLAVFEVLGLLADPMMPIAPDGHLANVLRVSLRHGQITIPAPVRRLFPELAEVVERPVELTLNLGTVITALQALAPALRTVMDLIRDGAGALAELAAHPPELPMSELLTVVPPELRKLRTRGDFAGFRGSALLVIMTPDEMTDAFDRRDRTPAVAPPPPAWTTNGDVDPVEVLTARPAGLPAAAGRTHDPDIEPLLSGRELSEFTAADLPAPRGGRAAVLVAAHVRVLGGSRYRFAGWLSGDGSFALATTTTVRPLPLRVLGVDRTLPLRIDGALSLVGRARRGGNSGSVTASGSASWKPLPGVLSLEIIEARLRAWSDGRFDLRGAVQGRLLAAELAGSIEVTPTQARLTGSVRYQVPGVLELSVVGEGRVGPGPRFELAGAGALSLLGQDMLDVRCRVTERRAEIEARLDGWRLASGPLPGTVSVRATGTVGLAATAHPSVHLAGALEVNDLLGVGMRGRGELTIDGAVRRVRGEGRLSWQGRDWLAGEITLGPDGIDIAGRTTFALDLTPSGGAAGVQLLQLVLQLELGGRFTLRPGSGAAAALARVRLEGSWALAVRLPGDSGQVVPIAAQRLLLGSTTAALDLLLVDLHGLDALPLRDLLPDQPSITVPAFPELDLDPPAARLRAYVATAWPHLRHLRAQAGDVSVWLPAYIAPADRELVLDAAVPSVSFASKTFALTMPAGTESAAHVQARLVWMAGRLAVKVVAGSESALTYLDQMLE